MNKDIRNYNKKKKYHGYQEWYQTNNTLDLRCTYKNGQPIGYYENHLNDWNPKITNFYIK